MFVLVLVCLTFDSRFHLALGGPGKWSAVVMWAAVNQQSFPSHWPRRYCYLPALAAAAVHLGLHYSLLLTSRSLTHCLPPLPSPLTIVHPHPNGRRAGLSHGLSSAGMLAPVFKHRKRLHRADTIPCVCTQSSASHQLTSSFRGGVFNRRRQLVTSVLLHGTEVNECTVKSRETGRWAALVCQQQQLD